jgi:hypothetical protein
MGYGLNDRDSIPGRTRGFSFLHSVQTGCGAHIASYQMGMGLSFLEGKAVGALS